MARTIVTGDQQRSISRKLAELLRQASQEKGYPHDPAALDEVLQHLNQFGPESLLAATADKNSVIVADKNNIVVADKGSVVIDCSGNPLVPKGWSIRPEDQISSAVRGQVVLNPAKIVWYLDKWQRGDVLIGHRLLEKLKGRPVLTAHVLDHFLSIQNLRLVPECLRTKGSTLSFWGTVYRDSNGNACVRCLAGAEDYYGWKCVWTSRTLHDDWGCSWLDRVRGSVNLAALLAA